MKKHHLFSKKLFCYLLLAILGVSMAFFTGCSSDSDDDTTDSGNNTDTSIDTSNMEKVVLINLGDSLGNGVQSGSGNVNQYTQVNSYSQVLANQLKKVTNLTWNNPLVNMQKQRIDESFYPYNLAVDGATVKSLLNQKSDEWDYMNELFKPIPSEKGRAVTQLEAAEYVADLAEDSVTKIITLFIGNNDVLGTVTAGGGTELTAPQIMAFLNDQSIDLTKYPPEYAALNAGHDLTSVTTNLSTIIDRLTDIPNSHIFICTLPAVTGIAGLFNNEDLERLATYDNPNITALDDGEYLGFLGVMGYGSMIPSLGPYLAMDNTSVNYVISQLKANDPYGEYGGFTLTATEAALINARVDAINDHIRDLADENANVYLVDTNSFFDDLIAGKITIGGDTLTRSYGGGAFSMDGFHPSNTGYALVADLLIDAINDADILENSIAAVDLETIWNSDPYHDKDGDGYVPGPGWSEEGLAIIDFMFSGFLDCDDTDATVQAPFTGSVCE